MSSEFSEIHSRYPFLTLVLHQKTNQLVGVVQLIAPKFTTIFLLDVIKIPEQKKLFLELAEEWWYGSNRALPISIFLKNDIDQFRFALRTYPSREIQVLIGPSVSLQSMVRKRLKKRSIVLPVREQSVHEIHVA